MRKVPPQRSHVPKEISLFYEIGKKPGNKKRVVCIMFPPMFPCSHGNISLLWNFERSKEIKRELFAWGEVLKLVRSPEVWEHARAHALGCPSLRRTHSYGNLPYTQHFSSQSFWLLIKPFLEQHEWKQCQVRRSCSDHRPDDFGGLWWDRPSGVRANSFKGFSVFSLGGGGRPLLLTYSEMLPMTEK